MELNKAAPIPIYVVNLRRDRYDIYIGRGSKWGNPYTHLLGSTKAEYRVATREESIEKYLEYIIQNEYLMKCLSELKGKTLG